jgi:hypothetical protein
MLERLYSRPYPWKGIVAGMAGGLIGTVAMGQFQKAWTAASNAIQANSEGEDRKDSPDQGKNQSNEESEDATMKVAGKLARAAGHKLSHDQKKAAGPFIHYGFGTAIGMIYALAREFEPRQMRGLHPVIAGSGYGAAVFLGADEVAVPSLGLSQGNGDSPLSAHVYGLLSHLVYGVTLEIVRESVRKRL